MVNKGDSISHSLNPHDFFDFPHGSESYESRPQNPGNWRVGQSQLHMGVDIRLFNPLHGSG